MGTDENIPVFPGELSQCWKSLQLFRAKCVLCALILGVIDLCVGRMRTLSDVSTTSYTSYTPAFIPACPVLTSHFRSGASCVQDANKQLLVTRTYIGIHFVNFYFSRYTL